MSKMTEEQARKTRLDAIDLVKASKSIRSDTQRNLELLDETCCAILEKGRPLSVPEVVRVMKEKFPGDALSKSSISNNTTAGDAYKEVIAAWKNYGAVIGSIKPIKMPDTASDDISDLILSQIKPRELIPTILAMRTSLRNARKQLQLHQIVNTSKPLIHEAIIKNGTIKLDEGSNAQQLCRANLTESDIVALKSFIDPIELGVHGMHWNDIGQLLNDYNETISRPGLRDAINKIITMTQ